MLASKYRFHSRGGVKYTYQKGKTIRTPKFSLVFAPNQHGKQRFAVVISKKVIKSAVGRNRVRRRVYEAIRLNLAEILESNDYIFIVFSKDLKTMDFTEIEKLVLKLAEQAKIAKK
ncbi:ribonuclease P protein component [Candidatus Saccharibacteria bacterium]|nr:ribonuclease P protein component [Candidatus Saccharibacteria bacterium]